MMALERVRFKTVEASSQPELLGELESIKAAALVDNEDVQFIDVKVVSEGGALFGTIVWSDPRIPSREPESPVRSTVSREIEESLDPAETSRNTQIHESWELEETLSPSEAQDIHKRHTRDTAESAFLTERIEVTKEDRNRPREVEESLTPSEATSTDKTVITSSADAASLDEDVDLTVEARTVDREASEELTPSEADSLHKQKEFSTSDTASLDEDVDLTVETRPVKDREVSESVTPSEADSIEKLVPPSGLTMTWNSNLCIATLSWNDDSTGEDGYRVYRDGVEIGTTGANAENFNDDTAAASTSYTWTVAPFKGGSEAGGSDVTDTTGTCDGPS